jgi:hypothetical protein
LRKNLLGHFNTDNPKHMFPEIACTKKCHKKAKAHHANITANLEDQNIACNRVGEQGPEDDPNNLENILISWLPKPGNI